MANGPTIGVLALQGDVREHLAMLRGAGADAVPVRRESELARVDGIVMPGGESTTMHKLAVAFEIFEPLRERVRSGLPALGTCAGMIMLADRIENGVDGQQTIGGLDITVRRNAFGRQVDSFEADVDFEALREHGRDRAGREHFHAVFIRAPWVEKVGSAVQVLARVAADSPADSPAGGAGGRIVAVQQEHLLATSFHPEITGDDRIHRHFVGLVQS
ncbi:MAG TPA: pyridoxal 5'-phosphate synthase glutaminase subunit PdxT [Nocardioidaceae bacterium]|nr:pyridoxal 5'-phosphate synthase glutaminase subunit PdxT [Nocardioidaceae bacterium]